MIVDADGFQVAATRFESAIADLDLATFDADGLERLVGLLRRVQARIEGAIVQVGMRADELSAAGAAAPARDALLGVGEVRGATARREAARASLAARTAELGQLMGAGRLGPDHLDVLVRQLGPLTDDHVARVLADGVVERAPGLPADTFDRSLRQSVTAAAVADDMVDPAAAARAEREVRHWFDPRTGMGHLTARLDPEHYEAVADALDQHASALANRPDGPTTKNDHLAADAFVELVCGSGARRPSLPLVTVVVDATTLGVGRRDDSVAETGDGRPLSDEAVARLCCDAVVRRVLLDERGVPVDVGRRFRTATSAQWSALRALYTTCAWFGCDRPLRHCQAHHIRSWQHGGPTDLANLVPLCSHHHHLVHEGRWRIELGPDRALRIVRPDGRLHRTTDPPTRRPPPEPGRWRRRRSVGTAP